MIKQIKMYAAICDSCKTTLDLGGFMALNDKEAVKEAIRDNEDCAILTNKRVYCPYCHVKKWDEDKDVRLAYNGNTLLGEVE